jgi:hypothetical protein
LGGNNNIRRICLVHHSYKKKPSKNVLVLPHPIFFHIPNINLPRFGVGGANLGQRKNVCNKHKRVIIHILEKTTTTRTTNKTEQKNVRNPEKMCV